MILDSYRYFCTELRNFLRIKTLQRQTQVPIAEVEHFIDLIEDDYEVNNRYKALERINHPNGDVVGNYSKMIDHHIRAVSASHDKHVAYTQLVVTAGYAAFFGLWTITKDNLDLFSQGISALFLAISALSFVFFEVIKMLFIALEVNFSSKVLLKAKAEETLERKVEGVEKITPYENCLNLWFSRIWFVTFCISVFFGVLAVGILFYGFVRLVIDNNLYLQNLLGVSALIR